MQHRIAHTSDDALIADDPAIVHASVALDVLVLYLTSRGGMTFLLHFSQDTAMLFCFIFLAYPLIRDYFVDLLNTRVAGLASFSSLYRNSIILITSRRMVVSQL